MGKPFLTQRQVIVRFIFWAIIGAITEYLYILIPLHEWGHVLVARLQGDSAAWTSWTSALWTGHPLHEEDYPWYWYVGILTAVGWFCGIVGQTGGPGRNYYAGFWWGAAIRGWFRALTSWDWYNVPRQWWEGWGRAFGDQQVAARVAELTRDWMIFGVILGAFIVWMLWRWWTAEGYAPSPPAESRPSSE